MFNDISFYYDVLNRILSLGMDIIWRKKVVNIIFNFKHKKILDIATGTGDLAIMLAKKFKNSNIIGIDLSEKMLDIGIKKINYNGLEKKIKMIWGNSENLCFEKKTFNIVTISFGIRNFKKRKKVLKEIYRVLKHRGKIIILEFSKPKNFILKYLYYLYSHYILINFTKFVLISPYAYEYLVNSIEDFSYLNIKEELKNCGFCNLSTFFFTFGIVSIYLGEKV